MKKQKRKKKLRLRLDRLFIFLFCVFLFRIKNIYVTGYSYLKEQEVIQLAQISDYPSTLSNPSFQIEKNLESNYMILNAKVYKKGLSKVYIEIEENRPLFYYEYTGKTIHYDGSESDLKYTVPTVINYITDSYYNDFIEEMKKLDLNIISRISEIQFYPNEVDDNRFLLYMSDGNYVYVNIDTFNKLNKYLTILESLPNKKGILYLDYGNNFEIIS
jgi:cell division septal protein FtsQ